jgi:Bacterial Ig-like domain (group 2)
MKIAQGHEVLQKDFALPISEICRRRESWPRALALGILCVTTIVGINCGIAGKPPSGTSSNVSVTVTPPSASVLLGATQQFQAIVTGDSNTTVTWEVNNVPGGTASSGTISAAGLYTAPAILPSSPSVVVTAVSRADTRASGSAIVSLTDDIVVMVAPMTANIPTGGEQVFMVSTSGAGSAAAGVAWRVNGIAGGNSIVGTIATTSASTALYTAPSAPPSPPTVTVTATSAADSSKFGSASVTITCAATNSISPL